MGKFVNCGLTVLIVPLFSCVAYK